MRLTRTRRQDSLKPQSRWWHNGGSKERSRPTRSRSKFLEAAGDFAKGVHMSARIPHRRRTGIPAIVCGAFLLVLVLAATGKAHAAQPSDNSKSSYFVIPIKGTIGSDFTADRMKVLLKQAQTLKPTVVVLEIDTGGGSVVDAQEIIDQMIANKEVRFVALVRRALSAGAAITLACKEIYMADGAILGGAVSYMRGEDGLPVRLSDAVAEKMQSIWRAVCRKAAEFGGHPTLIAEAMVDPDFALTMRKVGDKVVFERNGSGEVIKANKRILTMTANEAVSCQLALGLASDIVALGEKLLMPGWTAADSTQAGSPQQVQSLRLASFLELLARIPRKIMPLKAEATPIEEQALIEWANDEIVGKKITVRIRAKDVLADTFIGLADLPIKVNGRTPACLVEARLSGEQKLATMLLQNKNAVEVTGTVMSFDLIVRVITYSNGNVLQLPAWNKDNVKFCLELGDCVLKGARGTATASSSIKSDPVTGATDDSEKKALGDLNLAKAFRRNGLHEKALALLNKIISDYPDTTVSEAARKEVAQIQEEMSKNAARDVAPAREAPKSAPSGS